MSLFNFFYYTTTLLQFVLDIPGLATVKNLALQFGILLPNSRKTEIEADYVGLLLMAMACFDPNEALCFWERMDKTASESEGITSRPSHSKITEFISTHPSHYSRIETIRKWMQEALDKRAESECSDANDFWSHFKWVS
jgi:metalloendopeptidase OMA1, mitochondrial